MDLSNVDLPNSFSPVTKYTEPENSPSNDSIVWKFFKLIFLDFLLF